ncbi:hypothetical protein J2746_000471 [Methanolobus bombayensis]|nr:hypothetical protein [Methanolobus bombayensis]
MLNYTFDSEVIAIDLIIFEKHLNPFLQILL